MLVNQWTVMQCPQLRTSMKLPRTVSVAIFRKKDGQDEVLVGLRDKNPKKQKWALPGGHVDDGETLAQAAIREIKEETGIELKEQDLIFVERHKRKVGGNEKERIDIVFYAQVPEDVDFKAASDVDELHWRKTDDLSDLVFNHDKSIKKALDLMSPKQKKTASSKIDDEKPLPPEKRGILIVLEGVDGSGKSTAAAKLSDWLESQGYAVVSTSWNTSRLLKKPMKKAKKEKVLSPLVFSMLSMTDMILRYENIIKPALERNHVVICDRYIYTSLVRDGIRGVSEKMILNNYEEFREPDVLFYCSIEPETAVKRVTKAKGLKYYSAGLDLGLSPNKEESCLKYTSLMKKAYDRILPEKENYVKIDMSESIEDVFSNILDKLSKKFRMHWAED